MRVQRILIVTAAFLAALIPALFTSSGGATEPPPPGWTPELWNALPAAKQTSELMAYPQTGGNPQAKLDALAQNPNPGPDASIEAEATVDGPGAPYASGVQDSSQSPLPTSHYLVTNSWSDLVATAGPTKSEDTPVVLYVYAGKRTNLTNGQGQPLGFLFVQETPYPSSQGGTVENEYHYACRPGPLTISSGTPTSVAFTDADGIVASFSLVTRTFTPGCPSS